MTPTQIAVLSIALAGFVGLLVFAPKLRIRARVVLLAGAGGTALGLLVTLLISRITSIGQLATGVLLVCAAGALGSVAVSLFVQRMGRRGALREAPVRQAHAPKPVSAASGLLGAQGREFALLTSQAPQRAADALPEVAAAEAEPPQTVILPAEAAGEPAQDVKAPDPLPEAEAVPMDETAIKAADGAAEAEPRMPEEDEQAPEETAFEEQPGDETGAAACEAPAVEPKQIERLAKGFRREQERRAQAEEKRLEAARLAREEEEKRKEQERRALEEEVQKKEQERTAKEEKRRRDRERRIIRRGEERRLKDTRVFAAEADEAQRIRERIKEERQKVAIEEQKKLDADIVTAQSALDTLASQEDAVAAISWELEQERLARELEERRREQEKAAEEEKRWLMEQERLARELEERKREQERLELEQQERRLEQERLAREQEERKRERERLEREQEERGLQQERLAREQEERKQEQERLAREQQERLLEQEKAAEEQRHWQEEQQRLEREQEERRVEQKRLERAERERREKAEREQAEQEARRIAEATGYIASGQELAESGKYVEALQWLEKASRMEVPNEMKVTAGVAVVEALVALGWKTEAIKKMQTMKTSLAIDAENRKRLGELAMKLVG